MLKYQFINPDDMIASEDFALVENFLKAIVRRQIGWHYITDMVWIYSKAKNWPRGSRVLDAGVVRVVPLSY